MKKVAVITGGTKGIGLAMTKKFLQNDFKVYAISRNNSSTEEVLKNENYCFLQADLSVKKNNKEICNLIIEKEKKINVLVNNVGVFKPGKLMEESDELFEELMNLNIYSPYFTTKYLYNLLKESKDAYIFNISSVVGQVAYPNGGTYSITKHALTGFTKVLRKELLEEKIPVTNVVPGATYTDSWNGIDLPKERFIQPENVANLIFEAWNNREFCVVEEIVIRPILGDL